MRLKFLIPFLLSQCLWASLSFAQGEIGGFPISLSPNDGSQTGVISKTDYNAFIAGIASSGDVDGPASSTDNACVRFDGTTGKLIQNSSCSIDDSGNLTATNISGTNTGDVSLSAYSTSGNANPLTLSGQAITAHAASATQPGMINASGNQTLGASLIAPSFQRQIETQAASGGTKTLSVTSASVQVLTGSANHTYKLPDATTLGNNTVAGWSFYFINTSSGTLTVKDQFDSTLATLLTKDRLLATATSIGLVNGTWALDYSASAPLTVGAFGASPNSSGATLSSGNALTLQPASISQPGGLSTGTQQIAGSKQFNSTIESTAGHWAIGADGTSQFGDNKIQLWNTGELDAASGVFEVHSSGQTDIGRITFDPSNGQSQFGDMDLNVSVTINRASQTLGDGLGLGSLQWAEGSDGTIYSRLAADGSIQIGSPTIITMKPDGTLLWGPSLISSLNADGSITSTSLSGTNTGDVTLAAVGLTPNANAATLVGQVLNLEVADGINPGLISLADQVMGDGNKEFQGNISIPAASGYLLNGSGDPNWQIGLNLGILGHPNITTNATEVIVGSGVDDGFVIGNADGDPYLELDTNSKAWFHGAVNALGDISGTGVAATRDDGGQAGAYSNGVDADLVIKATISADPDPRVSVYSSGPSAVTFGAASGEAMRVASDNKVLVGATTADGSGAGLQAATGISDASQTADSVVVTDANKRLISSSLTVTDLEAKIALTDLSATAPINYDNSTGAFTLSLLVDADIDDAAEIAGTKIAPDFGDQAVTTTGSLTGDSLTLGTTGTIDGITTATFLGAGNIVDDTAGGLTFNAATASIDSAGLFSGTGANLSGDLVLNTDGKGIQIKMGGSAAKSGTSTLTLGTVTVSTTGVHTGSLVFLTDQDGTCAGNLSKGTVVAETSFDINSTVGTDGCVVAWLVIDPSP